MRRLLFVASLALCFISTSVLAQQSQSFGDYSVHYNALSASLLSPQVAQAYDIQRSNQRAVLNISVLRENAENDATPVHAQVTASAINLTGQRRDIKLREVQENEAIYYIGEFRVHNLETYNFTIEVTPDGKQNPYKVEFRQQFYTE